MDALHLDPQLAGCRSHGQVESLLPGDSRPENALLGRVQLLGDLGRQGDIPVLAALAHNVQETIFLVHVLALQAGDLRDPQPAAQGEFSDQ